MLPPIDPAAKVTYRQYGPTSWVAHIGRQAIDEGLSRKDLLDRLRTRGCTDPRWVPLRILKIV